MRSPSVRDIRDALRRPVAEPPSGLAQRLKDAIPAELGDGGEGGAERPATSWHPARWAAAASIVVALGAGLAGWRLMQSDVAPDAKVADAGQLPVVVPEPLARRATPAPGDRLRETGDTAAAAAAPEAEFDDRQESAPAPSRRLAAAPEAVDTLGRSSRAPDVEPLEPREAGYRRAQNAQVEELERQKGELEAEMRALEAPAAPAAPTEAKSATPPGILAPSRGPRVAVADRTGGDTARADDRFVQAPRLPFVDTDADPQSTFGLDVDTGSFTLARRYLESGVRPPAEAVRVEEFLNYFDYGDPAPLVDDLAIHVEGGPTPFTADDSHRLLRIGITARRLAAVDRRPANLVFLIDVSGSMARDGRLSQVKSALSALAAELSQGDRVGIVAYRDTAGIVLESTDDRRAVDRAVAGLVAGGSTHLAAGLDLAYALAARHWMTDGINRIVLCSDGVANVGATTAATILAGVDAAVREGIEITAIGFGFGDYNDALMEQLADRGNGSYFYVDSPAEARRVVVENLTGTLETVAADARVQVTFDPRFVSAYRLLGYENRAIADRRFRDDSTDAGEIGAGHSVVALYEVALRDARPDSTLAELRLRWRDARGQTHEASRGVARRDLVASWASAPPSLRQAAVAAELAEVLRGTSPHRASSLQRLAEEAAALGETGSPKQRELARLVAATERLLNAP